MKSSIIIAIAQREIDKMLKDKDLRMMCFIAPLLYGIILTSTYYKGRLTEIPMGVIDQDQTQLSRTFLRNIDASENIKLAQRFSNSIEATEATLQGKTEGFILIPKNFSNKIKQGVDATAFISVSSSNFMISTPVITTFSEVSSFMGIESLQKAMIKKGTSYEKAQKAKDTINLSTDISFNPSLSYSNFMIPALLFAILQQVMMVALAFTFVDEREKGNLNELFQKAKGNPHKLILGKILPYLFLNLIISIVFCYLILPFFGLSPQSSLALIFLISFLFVLMTTLWGILISTFFKTTTAAMIGLMFYSMPIFLFSGVSWPASAMNLPIKIVRFIFPSTYFLSDLRAMVLAPLPLSFFCETIVIMVLFSVISYSVICYIFKKWQRNKKVS